MGGLLTYHVAGAQRSGRRRELLRVEHRGRARRSPATSSCPIQFHFGEADGYIPLDQVAQIEAAFAGRADAEVHVQPGAGHAFDNHESAMFHNPDAAAAAWALTTGFLAKHLPVS